MRTIGFLQQCSHPPDRVYKLNYLNHMDIVQVTSDRPRVLGESDGLIPTLTPIAPRVMRLPSYVDADKKCGRAAWPETNLLVL